MVYVCSKCNRIYYYDIKKCIFCKSEVAERRRRGFKVKALTEVFVPSSDHKQVPYFDVLVEDGHGNLGIKKSGKRYVLGESFGADEKKDARKIRLGVVGTGIMGQGIAENALMKGFEVVLLSRTEESIKKVSGGIEKFLTKFMGEEEKKRVLRRYRPSTDLNDLRDVDLVIESVIEDKKVKDDYFKRIDGVCGDEAVIATNTSSLSVDALSKNLRDPSRMLGIHFFNPVTKMALVEIVKTKNTSERAVKIALDFVRGLGKVPVMTKDTPGFIVNRILMPYLNEAAMLYQQGVASKEDIDKAARLGLNHPMGPLSLIDLIGLDVFLGIMNNLRKETADNKYLPADVIKKMVEDGKLGRKTGEGFFKYKQAT